MLDMKLRNGKAFGAQEHLSRRKANARTLRNQRASPLLRLPGEIRNTIYQYALGGYHVYLDRYVASKEIFLRALDGEETPKRHLPLSQTCRQTHSESALMLFSLNDFFGAFHSTKGQRQRQRQRRHDLFLPSQRNAIRNISVQTCCFRHFRANDISITTTFGGLQRITVLAGKESMTAENIDKVKRQVSQLLGNGKEVALKDRGDLYK